MMPAFRNGGNLNQEGKANMKEAKVLRRENRKETQKEKDKRISQMISNGCDEMEKENFDIAEKIFTEVEKESPVLGTLWLSRVFARTDRKEQALEILRKYENDDDDKVKCIMFVEELNLLLAMNQPDKALALFKERYPGNSDKVSNSILAVCHLNFDDAEKAEFYALRAVDEKEPNARQLLGDIYAFQENWQGAYEQFMQGYPEDRKLSYRVASALMKLDRNAEALPFLQESLRQGQYEAAPRLASLYLMARQYKRAIDIAEAGVKYGFKQSEYILAHAYKGIGEYEKALVYFKKSIDAKIVSDSMYTNIAQCYIELKQYDNAILVLDMAMKHKEENVWFMRGMVYMKHANDAQAMRCFRKSMEVEPDNALMASCQLGRVFFNRKDFKKAMPYFQDAWSGGLLDGAVALGDCAYFQEKYEQAASWYQKAYEHGAESAMYPLAHAYRHMKEYDKARDLFLQCVEKGDDRAHIGLALVAAASGELEEADAEFGISVEKGLQDVNTCYGRFLLERGDYFTASVYLEKGWEEDRFMWALPYLVRALFKLGKPLHSLKKIKKYIQVCIDHGILLDGLFDNTGNDGQLCEKSLKNSRLNHYRNLENYDV